MNIIYSFPTAHVLLHVAGEAKPVALLVVLARKLSFIFHEFRALQVRSGVDKIPTLDHFSKKGLQTFPDIVQTHVDGGNSMTREIFAAPKIIA